MRAHIVILLLVGVWSAAVTAKAGESAPARKLSLAPPKLPPELLKALHDANVNPQVLKTLQDVLENTFHQTVQRWVRSLQIAMDSLIESDGDVKDTDPGEVIFDEIDETIGDKVRRILREGLESKGIPPLDPFEYPSPVPVIFNVPNVIDVDGQLDNITFNGLASFEADVSENHKLVWLPPSVNVDVLFDILEKLLELSSDYTLDAHSEILDIWGKGNISIKFFSLKLDGQVKVAASIFVNVNPCFINLSIRKSKVEITGLFGGGVLTQLIGEVFTDLVNENLETVTSYIAQTAQDEVCDYLKSKSTLDLIKILQKILGKEEKKKFSPEENNLGK